MGRGKSTSGTETYNSQPRPLASLKDPKSFGEPPKHRDTVSLPYGVDSLSDSSRSRAEDAHSYTTTSSRRPEIASEEQEERKPSGPFIADTTGLDTSRFPKPPVRSFAGGPSSPVAGAAFMESPVAQAKPSLPPRLPPRQPSGTTKTSEQDASRDSPTNSSPRSVGYLNQSAIDRLGKSGVSVPGFGTGSNTVNDATKEPPKGVNASEFNSKFDRLNVSGSNHSPIFDNTSIWSNSGKDSMSISDMKNTAAAAKSIHENHGDQISQGVKTMNNADEKYNIANKLNRLSPSNSSTQASSAGFGSTLSTMEAGQSRDTGGRKPPPPPVPSKAALMSKISRPPP